MAGYVEWDDIEKPARGGGGSNNGGKFLRLEANKEYTLRPVFRPVRFYKYYNKKDGQLRTAIIDDPNTCTVRPRHSELKKAQERRAMLAFHREDGNKLKIVEGPASMFEAFKHFKKLAKEEPGGPKGGDFKLKVVCPTGVKDRETTYELEFDAAKPFTEEEKNFVREHKAEYDLEKIFASHTPEEVEQLLFGQYVPKGKDNAQGGPVGGTAKSAAQEQVAVGAGKSSSTEEDDPFKW